jgi:type II secretory pathway pseudopilin PulG
VNTALLIGILAALIGLSLIVAGRREDRERRKYKQLATQNLRLRQVVRAVEVEARAQLAAGNATFEQTSALISDYREKEEAA